MSNVHIQISAIHSALCARLALAPASVAAAIMLYATCAVAPRPRLPARGMPARTIPVPDTVSPQMQKLIAAPLPPTWNAIRKTAEEWKAQVDDGAAAVVQTLPALREQLRVKVEPMAIGGVKAFMVTPENIPPENRNRLLIHVHGGCYVSLPGVRNQGSDLDGGVRAFQNYLVDYRMPPDHPYPAGLDDAIAVWKAALKMADPKNMAIFGSSAGGVLTLSMVLRAKQDNLPLPAQSRRVRRWPTSPARATAFN